MAFRMEVTGMDELLRKMEKLGEKGQAAASLALYEGARVTADAVGQAVNSIATEPFKYAGSGQKRKPSPEEKAAIQGAPHGVAKFKKRLHSVDTTVGYNNAGYVDVNFKRMSSNARTNYKKFSFKGHESNASSYLKTVNQMTGGSLGKGAQNQKPVGVIANAINSGTSFMEKQPFMRRAFSQSKGAAQAAIENKLREELDKLSED